MVEGSSSGKKLMFDQLFEQLDSVDPKKIQRTDRGKPPHFPLPLSLTYASVRARGSHLGLCVPRDAGFKVKFVGESSDDHGGPYREALTYICGELQSDASKLFVLCPNGKHNLGLNRSSFTIRPSAESSDHLKRFAFFGKLMGCALLQKQASLDLELCPNVWKRLVSVSRLS